MALPAVYTVLNSMVLCGVDNVIQFAGETAAERIATQIFANDFYTCMDKSMRVLDVDFKSYSELTIAEGRIRLLP